MNLIRPEVIATGLLHQDLIVLWSGRQIFEDDVDDDEEEDEKDLELGRPHEREHRINATCHQRSLPELEPVDAVSDVDSAVVSATPSPHRRQSRRISIPLLSEMRRFFFPPFENRNPRISSSATF